MAFSRAFAALFYMPTGHRQGLELQIARERTLFYAQIPGFSPKASNG
jgi:hypothetical protein